MDYDNDWTCIEPEPYTPPPVPPFNEYLGQYKGLLSSTINSLSN